MFSSLAPPDLSHSDVRFKQRYRNMECDSGAVTAFHRLCNGDLLKPQIGARLRMKLEVIVVQEYSDGAYQMRKNATADRRASLIHSTSPSMMAHPFPAFHHGSHPLSLHARPMHAGEGLFILDDGPDVVVGQD